MARGPAHKERILGADHAIHARHARAAPLGRAQTREGKKGKGRNGDGDPNGRENLAYSGMGTRKDNFHKARGQREEREWASWKPPPPPKKRGGEGIMSLWLWLSLMLLFPPLPPFCLSLSPVFAACPYLSPIAADLTVRLFDNVHMYTYTHYYQFLPCFIFPCSSCPCSPCAARPLRAEPGGPAAGPR